MRRLRVLSIAAASLILLTLAGSCMAVFDSTAPFPKPDGLQTFQMVQGWWNSKLAWFIMTETTDIKMAQKYKFPGTAYSDGLTLDYKLASAIDVPGLPRGFAIVINSRFVQAPILESAPAPTDTDGYSGLWGIFFVKWRAGATQVVLKSWADITARLGIDLDWSNVYGETAIDGAVPWIILDAPVVAIGKLGGPWWPAPPGDADNYRIKQAKVSSNYTTTKKIQLPTWYIYAPDCIARKVRVFQLIIPEIWDPAATQNPPELGTLADRLGATWNPGIANMPVDDTEEFFEFFAGVPPSIQRPSYQFPVTHEAPCASCWGRNYNPFSWRNLNTEYSAIYIHILLYKQITGDPRVDESFFKSVFTNEEIIDELIGAGRLTEVVTGYMFNAPMVPPILDPPQPR